MGRDDDNNPSVADTSEDDSEKSGGGAMGWLFLVMLALSGWLIRILPARVARR
jgi:hypothetical protein